MKYLVYNIESLIVAVLCIALYVIFDKKSKKIQIIDIVMIIIMIIISGIRCNFGSDSYNYYIQYNHINYVYSDLKGIFIANYQSGFAALCYIVYNFTKFKFAIFWAVAIIVYPTIIIYMRKYTQRPSIAFAVYVLMGFFVISNNILKQEIAMTILIVAYYSFLKKNKKIRYILLVAIASMFHITAIIGGIAIWGATKIKPSYKNLIKYSSIGVILSVVYNVFMPILLKIPVFEKYVNYLTIERSDSTILRGTLNIICYIIIYIIISIILLHNKDKIKDIEDDDNYGYEQISFLFIAIMISIISVRNITMNRIGLYLYQFVVFSLPSLFVIKYDYQKRKFYLIIITLLMLVWFLVNNIIGAENRYYSYSTYFNSIPKPYY